MQQMIFIADLIACSTCFGRHYAHHQELESISHSMLMAEMCAGWKKTLLFVSVCMSYYSLLTTCTHLGHQHRMTVTRGCIDTICLCWWWARCARNM